MSESRLAYVLLVLMVVAGALLEAAESLTTWWGIAIVAALAIAAEVQRINAWIASGIADPRDVDMLVVATAAGVFLGDWIYDAWWGVMAWSIVMAALAFIFSAAFRKRRRA